MNAYNLQVPDSIAKIILDFRLPLYTPTTKTIRYFGGYSHDLKKYFSTTEHYYTRSLLGEKIPVNLDNNCLVFEVKDPGRYKVYNSNDKEMPLAEEYIAVFFDLNEKYRKILKSESEHLKNLNIVFYNKRINYKIKINPKCTINEINHFFCEGIRSGKIATMCWHFEDENGNLLYPDQTFPPYTTQRIKVCVSMGLTRYA